MAFMARLYADRAAANRIIRRTALEIYVGAAACAAEVEGRRGGFGGGAASARRKRRLINVLSDLEPAWSEAECGAVSSCGTNPGFRCAPSGLRTWLPPQQRLRIAGEAADRAQRHVADDAGD